ncbi:MAG: PDZ domain-containing protein [Nibricoccus sp.]
MCSRCAVLHSRFNRFGLGGTIVLLMVGHFGLLAGETKESGTPPAEPLQLPKYDVKGDRLEDFGFRISHDFDPDRHGYTPVVDLVLPNTAASRAGLRPGDRILASDGSPVISGTKSLSTWRDFQKAKWREVEKGNTDVGWTLKVESPASVKLRTVVLKMPTPAPHWGSPIWRAPQDRTPAKVTEAGPLAERAEQVLNNGIWMLLRHSYVLGFKLSPTSENFPPFLCYQWTLWTGSVAHRMCVSQQRGRTDVVLEVIYRDNSGFFGRSSSPTDVPERNLASATTVTAISSLAFLTTPSGRLEKCWKLPTQQEIPSGAAQAAFQTEVDFWTKQVGKVSEQWPLEVLPRALEAAKK